MDRLEAMGNPLDIHEAAAAGKKARIEEILAVNPGSVNHPDLAYATPMHYAAACGQLAVANTLLSQGAALSAKAKGLGDATPAHMAVEFASDAVVEEMAQTILGNGSDVLARKADGSTLLHIAGRRGNPQLIRFLLRKGADLSARDGSGRKAVDVATANALEVLRQPESIASDCYTARYRDVKRDNTYGIPRTWVNQFVTVSHFDLEQVKHLYGQCGDLLLTRSSWDEIGVEAAAHMGREDIANFFIERGAPVSVCTATTLGLASEVKKLIAEDPHRVRERGAHDFPLLWYTMFGKERPELAELLLLSGADVHARLAGGDNLTFARKKGCKQVEELLIKYGA